MGLRGFGHFSERRVVGRHSPPGEYLQTTRVQSVAKKKIRLTKRKEIDRVGRIQNCREKGMVSSLRYRTYITGTLYHILRSVSISSIGIYTEFDYRGQGLSEL